MKKEDTQHLDYLISQYMDGCLDPASKKSVEQKLLHDPGARALYKGQRDTQDLLDDWGSRIPLVNWEEFEEKLEKRLAAETVGGRAARAMRWVKWTAAAAALVLAAGVGYVWHGTGHSVAGPSVAQDAAASLPPHAVVRIDDAVAANGPSFRGVRVDDAPGAGGAEQGVADVVLIGTPEDAAAVESLKETIGFGLLTVAQGERPQMQSSVAAEASLLRKEDRPQGP